MQVEKREIFPGYKISCAEAIFSGALGYAGTTWLGRFVCTLSKWEAGAYCGCATVMHTLLMEDFERPRNFIKKHLPAALKNRITHLVIDTTTSVGILALFAFLTKNAASVVGVEYSMKDMIYLSCLTEVVQLVVNKGLDAVCYETVEVDKGTKTT